MKPLRWCVTVLLMIVFCLIAPITFAGESDNEVIGYTRLGVDQSGESYFEKETINVNIWPSGLAMVSLEEPSEGVRFFKAKPGWEMLELHHAPKRQYLLVLQGILEIHTSKNEIKQFEPGSILLVEDTYGKGHRTRNASTQNLILVWVGVEKDQ